MITCGDCGQTFQKFNSFKSHIQRKHNSRNHHEVEEGGDLDLSAEEDQGREDDAEEPKSFVEEMTRSLPLFMLKTIGKPANTTRSMYVKHHVKNV